VIWAVAFAQEPQVPEPRTPQDPSAPSGAPASTDALEPRNQLDDVLLEFASRGATADVSARLLSLSRELALTDPVRVEVLRWLGQVDERRGNVDEARTTLLDGIRTGQCEACRDLFQELELERRAARRPTTWTFDDEGGADPHQHGLFHPTAAEALGSIRLTTVTPAEEPPASVLVWATERRGTAADRLVIGLREGLEELEVVVRAVDREGALSVVVEDLAGRRFVAPTAELPADRWTTLVIRADDLESADRLPLRPDDARRVEIVEVPRGTADEASTLWFDAVTVR
jgi:hypothetical protein